MVLVAGKDEWDEWDDGGSNVPSLLRLGGNGATCRLRRFVAGRVMGEG